MTGKDIVYATSCAQDPTSSLYLIRRFNTRSGGIPGLEAEYFGAAGCTVAVGKVTMLANAEDKATSVTLNISAASLTLSIVPPTANSSSLCGYTNWPVGSPSTKDILGKTCDVQGIKIAPKSTDTFTVPYTLVGSTLTFAAPAAGAPNYAQIAGTYTAK